MPHSSGGGHSGGSSHGGSHGGHSSSSMGSHHYFPGARRYVYYVGGRPRYYYSRYDFSQKGIRALFVIANLIPVIVLTALMVLYCFANRDAIMPPQKLENTKQYQVEVWDHANVIVDDSTMKQTLNEFKDVTGITPVIYTINTDDWYKEYDGSLENYAYDKYVSLYKDETHWLIVYSKTKEDSSGILQDWYVEGMQGDDTDYILSYDKALDFHSCLNRCLDQGYSLENAVTQSFDNLIPYVMDKETLNILDFLPLITLGIFDLIMIISLFLEINRVKQYQEVKGDPDKEPKLCTCHNCRKTFIKTESGRCPHCGADVASNTR